MKTYHLANPYMRGNPKGDLKPLQRALHAAKLYSGEIDDVFGAGTGHACKSAWYRLGAPLKSCTPHGDQDLLNLLRGSTAIPPVWKLRRQARGFGLTKAEKQRQLIVAYANWGVGHEPQIHYAQVRPMDQLNHIEPLPWWSDCSEFVTTIYKWAGAPDPNGWNYNGLGNTDSMFSHGEFIPLSQAKPADVIIWGVRPTHHTAVIVDTSSHLNPILASHGQERGPVRISLSLESSYQRRPWVVKRYIND